MVVRSSGRGHHDHRQVCLLLLVPFGFFADALDLLLFLFLKLVITVVLTTIFARSKTGIRRTDSVLNRLIRGTIQTGLFASIFSLGDLLTFLTLPDTNLYGMFAIPIGRIYTNVSTCTVFSFNNLD